MTLSKKYAGLLAAAALVIPTASVAQEAVSDQANVVNETAQEFQEEVNALENVTAEADRTAAADIRDGDDRADHRDDDDFPWGLLGLLGLAGLLGLKKRDDHHRDVHVDDRRDSRPL